MQLLDIFPITIATAKLQSLTPEVISRAVALIDQSPQFDEGRSGSFTREQSFLDHPLFTDTKREVLERCKEFARSYSHEVGDIAICNSWANVVSPGEHIPSHQHNNSYISGSLYLTHGSSLSITNPTFLDLFGFMPRVTESNPRSFAAYQLNPEPGMVVLFPSRLQHGVSPSRGPTNRYSVAFNAIPVGPIGVPTSMLDLHPA